MKSFWIWLCRRTIIKIDHRSSPFSAVTSYNHIINTCNYAKTTQRFRYILKRITLLYSAIHYSNIASKITQKNKPFIKGFVHRLWRKSSPQPVFVSEPLFMCQH
ncbi:hypothetical protein CDB3_27915 [Bacillus sp. CDB3]|nr:hypothetical protein CDB3_27915 [Bacillus sp. CDB3]